MPATVIAGGQFGSEGKGKVAYIWAQRTGAAFAVRVGGSNSGHTAYDAEGRRHTFRHLPTAALLPDVQCILGPGCLIDPDVLREEVERIHLPSHRLHIDPQAFVITAAHRKAEASAGLVERIGSTGSGTGAALADRIGRSSNGNLARRHPYLRQFTRHPVRELLCSALAGNARVIVEGTQGFGLSNLQSPDYPKATSRDTTAATFVAEAALSPLDVDEVVLVIRAFPIRVAGDSGHLPSETDWTDIARNASQPILAERTTVTHRIRRVAHFDGAIVRAAISANRPTQIVLNHVDYVGEDRSEFVYHVEKDIGQKVKWIGTSPRNLLPKRHLIGGRDSLPTKRIIETSTRLPTSGLLHA